MPAESLHSQSFPYATYRDYVSALAAIDNAYQKLHHFLTSTPNVDVDSQTYETTQVPKDGSVTIIDRVHGRLELQEFSMAAALSEKSVSKCITALNQCPDGADIRIILFSYHRDQFTGKYTGVDTDLLDAVGKKFRVHPEVLMWHFGSDYGLDRRLFPFAKSPIPAALSNHTFCHLQNDHSLFSCCVFSSAVAEDPKTLIMFARDHRFPNWSLLTSRLVFLESSLPMPLPRRPADSRWINSLFTEAILQADVCDVSRNIMSPGEYIIPYAQMLLINSTFVMDTWAMKVMHPQGKTSANLEVHYDKQVSMLNEIRQNLDALRAFTPEKSSQRWNKMLIDYGRVLQNIEQQINVVLAQKMTYRAAMASLDESRMGIEHAKRSMEQNARVKRLTQLAFIFIPLSFSTSIFGMNLEVLGTGTAKAWMVVMAVVSAYAVTSLVWVIIDHQNIKAAFTARLERYRWPHSSSRDHIEESRPFGI